MEGKTKALKYVLLGIVILVMQSCWFESTKSTMSRLQGHWHMSAPYHNTVDIIDSIAIIDKYSFTNSDFAISLFDSATHEIALPTHCGCGGSILPLEKKFEIKGDTVFYFDADSLLTNCYSFTPMKLYRSDIDLCRQQHVTDDFNYILDLTEFRNATSAIINYDSLKKTSAIAAIILGYEKNNFKHDSVRIAVSDVFIDFNDIPRYLKEVWMGKGEHVPLVVCIIASKDVPQHYLDKVVATVERDTIKVDQYQLVSYGNDKKLGYQVVSLRNL